MHKVWCFPGAQPPRRRVARAQGFMVWLSIGDFGGGVYISHCVYYEAGSTQDSAAYVDTLKQAFLPHAETALKKYGRKMILVQDGAPTHTSKKTKLWLNGAKQRAVFSVLEGWPPRSPDLNPIENLWGWMKTKLMDLPPHQRDLGHIQETVQKLVESDEAIALAKRLIATFPKRCHQCYERNGGITDY
jgi:transposase